MQLSSDSDLQNHHDLDSLALERNTTIQFEYIVLVVVAFYVVWQRWYAVTTFLMIGCTLGVMITYPIFWFCKNIYILFNGFIHPVIIQGKCVLITGGSQGLGKEIAFSFAKRKASKIIIVARNEARLRQTKQEIESEYPHVKVKIFVQDLIAEGGVDRLFEFTIKEHYDIDIVVNNAGMCKFGPFLKNRPQDIDRIVRLNCIVPSLVMNRFGHHMLTLNGDKHIINISSATPNGVFTNWAAYGASKAYLTYLSETVKVELQGKNLTIVNAIPDHLHTDLMESCGYTFYYKWLNEYDVTAASEEMISQFQFGWDVIYNMGASVCSSRFPLAACGAEYRSMLVDLYGIGIYANEKK